MKFNVIKTKKALAEIPIKTSARQTDPDIMAILEATAEAQFGVKVDTEGKPAARVRALLMKHARKNKIGIRFETAADESAVIVFRTKTVSKPKSVSVKLKKNQPAEDGAAAEDTSSETDSNDDDEEDDEE